MENKKRKHRAYVLCMYLGQTRTWRCTVGRRLILKGRTGSCSSNTVQFDVISMSRRCVPRPGRRRAARRAECVQNGRATRSWAQSVFGVRDVHDGACQTVLVPLQRHMTALPDTNLVSQTTFFFVFLFFNGSWRQPEQEVRIFFLPLHSKQVATYERVLLGGVRGGSRRTCFSTGVAGLSAVCFDCWMINKGCKETSERASDRSNTFVRNCVLFCFLTMNPNQQVEYLSSASRSMNLNPFKFSSH